MSNKIKIIFAFLAVLAVFSVFSFFDVFPGIKSALIGSAVKPLTTIDDDADHDGLSNTDESYWNTDFQNPDTDGDGFLDGEEVASGHDPAIPAPDDVLIITNITDKASKLTIGGLLEGSLSPTNSNYQQTLSDLADGLIDEGVNSLNPQNPPTITIVDASKENQERYLVEAERVWQSFIKSFLNEIDNIDNKLELVNNEGYFNSEYIAYFSGKSREFTEIKNNLTKARVPNNWTNEHNYLYILLSQADLANKALADAKSDPIKATVALQFLGNIASNFPEIFQQYADKAKTNNLSGSSIFSLP